jgi:hypothetical protein
LAVGELTRRGASQAAELVSVRIEPRDERQVDAVGSEPGIAADAAGVSRVAGVAGVSGIARVACVPCVACHDISPTVDG